MDHRRSGRIELVQLAHQRGEWDVDVAGDDAAFQLAPVANVEDHHVGQGGESVGELHGGESRAPLDERRIVEKHLNRVAQEPRHRIEPNASEADLRLQLGARVTYQDDRLFRGDDVTGILCEPSLQSDVQCTSQMAIREVSW